MEVRGVGEWQNQITCLLKLYLVGSYLPHLSIRSNIMPHEDNYNIYHKRKKKTEQYTDGNKNEMRTTRTAQIHKKRGKDK